MAKPQKARSRKSPTAVRSIADLIHDLAGTVLFEAGFSKKVLDKEELVEILRTLEDCREEGRALYPGALRLRQGFELVSHFDSDQANDEMSVIEASSVVRACVQYVFGVEESATAIDFTHFRERLSSEAFSPDDVAVGQLVDSPLFFQHWLNVSEHTFACILATLTAILGMLPQWQNENSSGSAETDGNVILKKYFRASTTFFSSSVKPSPSAVGLIWLVCSTL